MAYAITSDIGNVNVPEQTDEQKKKAKFLVESFEKKKQERTNFESHWQECLRYIIPRKQDVISERSPGDKRGNELFDSTAIRANSMLAGALHSMLTNPTTRFFELIMGDPALDEDEEVKAFLQEAGERMFTMLSNSNFQTEIHEIYLDLGAIGTACLYMADHEQNLIHFSARHMKEIFIAENNEGLVDSVDRCFKWNARQIVQEFGEDKVPRFIKECYEKNIQEEFEILHVVQPAEDYKSGGSPLPYKSCYILKEKEFILSEGGYKVFPYAVPRWTKTSGEVYGRGPGMDLLPSIKMINSMMETTIKGAQKTIDPPMMVSDNSVIGKVRLTPAGLTLVRPSNEDPIRPLITDARIDFGFQFIDSIKQEIMAGFYVDQFTMAQGPQKTATEVNQLVEQNFRLMGPVLGRQHFELLRQVVERSFDVMVRNKKLPEAPPQIQGREFNVRYSSFIARVQRMNEGQNIARAIQVAAPILQLSPESAEVINGDRTLKYILDIYGVPQKVQNSNAELEEKREARAQAQAQMAQEQQQQAQADAIGTAGPAIAQLQQAQAAQTQ